MSMDILIYLLKVTISICILLLLFKVALSTDLKFSRNRAYLVGAMIWSLSIPLLTQQISIKKDNNAIIALAPAYTITLPMVTINAEGGADNSSAEKLSTILLTIYFTGIGIFLLKSAGGYAKVGYILATSRKVTINGYSVRTTTAAVAPFAFFRWIVFPEKLIEHQDIAKMLLHEQEHSRQLHSLDLLLCEVFTAIQWFNPAAWMLKRLVVENHEFTADRAVIELGIDTYEYQASLVNATMGREVVPVSHFSLILIKKRIIMINKSSSQKLAFLKGMIVPAAFVSALVLTSFTVEAGIQQLASISNSDSNQVTTFTKTTPASQTSKPSVQDDDKVFIAVEKMPYFGTNQEANDQNRVEFLARNLVYPTAAAEKGIVGTVYISFVIKKDGSVSDAKVAKSVDPLLDAEALRVVNLMPKWTPGTQNNKPVNVLYTMPFKFALAGIDSKESKKSNTNTSKKGGKSPMIVLDGIPYDKDIKNINPDDIESITVLKDKSALDIYGEDGKNGVILITTKKAKESATTSTK